MPAAKATQSQPSFATPKTGGSDVDVVPVPLDHPSCLSLRRGRCRRQLGGTPPAGAPGAGRYGTASDHPWGAVRRCPGRARDALAPDGPAVPHGGRLVAGGKLRPARAGARPECFGGFGFHGAAGSFRTAPRPADLLSRHLRGSGQSRHDERVRHRAAAHRAARRPRHPIRLLGRRGGPGLGHQSDLGRLSYLRGDAGGEPRFLHPSGRPDLCR